MTNVVDAKEIIGYTIIRIGGENGIVTNPLSNLLVRKENHYYMIAANCVMPGILEIFDMGEVGEIYDENGELVKRPANGNII
jgi:ADP-dependent phosphofructokinase/glucokinase